MFITLYLHEFYLFLHIHTSWCQNVKIGNVSILRQPYKLDFNKLTVGMLYYTNEPYYLNLHSITCPITSIRKMTLSSSNGNRGHVMKRTKPAS